MSDQIANTEQQPEITEQVTTRPWVRYWARMFDFYLCSFVVGIAIGLVNVDLFDKMPDAAFGALILLIWVIAETLFLTYAGTTPGKSLFKIRIHKSDGSAIGIKESFSRSVGVWLKGMGLGLPIVSLVTMIYSYNSLQVNGSSSWDQTSGFTINHEKIGWVRIAFALLLFFGFIALMILGLSEQA